ncbi:ABC-three component system protein [Shewanella sp. HL-SH5]|uniref:ABC-three component system protein n=1 Tax=Shewanella sp. HL-SH5 TaxID=3436241 RepID=UPI003EB9BCDE
MNKYLVVMVHGLTGGENTWRNNDGKLFAELLMEDDKIKQKFDFIEFDYFTKIVNLKNTILSKAIVGIMNIIPGLNLDKPIIKKNVSILSIADELAAFIECEALGHSKIIFVSHSMGGLISKKFILDQLDGHHEDITSDTIGYISLATPHRGSFPSLILGPFNLNAKELKPLDKDMTELNDKWVENFNILPKSFYLEAEYDECVGKLSASPNTNKKYKPKVMQEDHTSICKPKDINSLTLKIVKKQLLEIAHDCDQIELTKHEYDSEIHCYDKEIFVIKLLLASIEENLIEDAKESFFHAELVMKSATKEEYECFNELKVRIISIYRNYSSASKSKNANDIVKEVHSKIIELDKSSLDCVIKYLTFVHKKGILHQEANKNNLKINWDNAIKVEDINDRIKCNA